MKSQSALIQGFYFISFFNSIFGSNISQSILSKCIIHRHQQTLIGCLFQGIFFCLQLGSQDVKQMRCIYFARQEYYIVWPEKCCLVACSVCLIYSLYCPKIECKKRLQGLFCSYSTNVNTHELECSAREPQLLLRVQTDVQEYTTKTMKMCHRVNTNTRK